MIIGVDFDNTIVNYDRCFHGLARERGLIGAEVGADKKAVRDAIQSGPFGDVGWQKLQAHIYGPGIGEAELFPGAWRFLRRCRQAGYAFYIVSHKTEYANYDQTGTNLRQAALGWLRQKGFFSPDGLDMTPDRVFFGGTRQEKLDHIGRLACQVFIDDLWETFAEPGFPPGVQKILYSGHRYDNLRPDVLLCKDWEEIERHVFENRS